MRGISILQQKKMFSL